MDMNYLYWAVVFAFLLFILFGIKDWLGLIKWSWQDNGKLFTIFLAGLLILLISPRVLKDYAPQYYDASVIALIVYVAGLLIYRFGFSKEGS
jgi:hypothetical protein